MIGLLGSILGGSGGRLIGGMIGGRAGAMIGGMAGAMIGSRQIGRLGTVIGGGDNRLPDTFDQPPDPLVDADAEILIGAMCNAAKADGRIDQAESDQIMAQLGDLSAEEHTFLRQAIAAPFQPASEIARAVRSSLATELYAVSLISINVDTPQEATYLRDLATELGLSDSDRDAMHDDLGAERL